MHCIDLSNYFPCNNFNGNYLAKIFISMQKCKPIKIIIRDLMITMESNNSNKILASLHIDNNYIVCVPMHSLCSNEAVSIYTQFKSVQEITYINSETLCLEYFNPYANIFSLLKCVYFITQKLHRSIISKFYAKIFLSNISANVKIGVTHLHLVCNVYDNNISNIISQNVDFEFFKFSDFVEFSANDFQCEYIKTVKFVINDFNIGLHSEKFISCVHEIIAKMPNLIFHHASNYVDKINNSPYKIRTDTNL
jgi:hypothetical protein